MAGLSQKFLFDSQSQRWRSSIVGHLATDPNRAKNDQKNPKEGKIRHLLEKNSKKITNNKKQTAYIYIRLIGYSNCSTLTSTYYKIKNLLI